MIWVSRIAFAILLVIAVWFFAKRIRFIRRNILLGRDFEPTGTPQQRLNTMLRVALGQSKMTTRIIPAILHIIVYAGFILINIEILEIVVDGLLGTHRAFAKPLGKLYYAAIGFFEILAVLVILACIVFLYRRNGLKLKRFTSSELKGFPLFDANVILIVEIVLMSALLVMNAFDEKLQTTAVMPVSFWLSPDFITGNSSTFFVIERIAWWLHIIGVFVFLNYVPFSKHLHIILSFPNTYYTPQQERGKIDNLDSITTEMKLMLDPTAMPPDNYEPPTSFGAKDVEQLSWKNLLDAYSCTECGRCTSVCPANLTGKKLSPRKVMMDTRDRLEEVGNWLDKNEETARQKIEETSLHDKITAEELWACTTCNACVEACPVNINPLDIIVQMRQYLVMEQSAAPAKLNNMFSNLENNGSPWQMSQMDKANWVQES